MRARNGTDVLATVLDARRPALLPGGGGAHPHWSQLALQLQEELIRLSHARALAGKARALASEAAGAVRGRRAAVTTLCAAALRGQMGVW